MTIGVNLISRCWPAILIFALYFTPTFLEQIDGTTPYGGNDHRTSVPVENTNVTQNERVNAAANNSKLTEEVPIGFPVEKELFERMKDEAEEDHDIG